MAKNRADRYLQAVDANNGHIASKRKGGYNSVVKGESKMNTKSDMVPIPQGSLLTMTSGEYSDYSIHGVFRAKVDIDADALRQQWLQDHPEQQHDYSFEEDEFLAWVVTLGLLEPVDCYEWCLGSYGCVGHMNVTQMTN